MPSTEVVLVVEVTSSVPDRDRRPKRHCYARAGIPLYLLVDRTDESVTLFAEPGGGADLMDFRQETRVPFGKSLDLPAPLSFTLDTSRFC